jgi:hypothetical protein
MNEIKIQKIGFILDETDGKWENQLMRQARSDHRQFQQTSTEFIAERYDLIHMHMGFPFFD